MKIFIIYLSLNLLLVSYVDCQSSFDKGMIKYEITNVELLDQDESNEYRNTMLLGSTITIYFNSTYLRKDVNLMDGMMKYYHLTNKKRSITNLYINMQGHKLKVKLNNKLANDSNFSVEESNFRYDKSNNKTILGYLCYFVEIDTLIDNKKYAMYINENINMTDFSIYEINTADFKGIPLQLIVEDQKSKITYTAINFNKVIDNDVFTIDDVDYNELTMREFKEKYGNINKFN